MRATRSQTCQNSEDSESSVKSDSSQKRNREKDLNSPEKPKRNSSKRQKLPHKNPKATMGENNQVLIASEQWNVILSNFAAMNEKQEITNNRLESLENRMSNQELNHAATEKKVVRLEKIVSKLSAQIDKLNGENNQLMQNSLSRDFVIFGLPSFQKGDTEKVIDSLSQKSGVNFSKTDLNKFYATTMRKDKKKCIVHGQFYNEKLKSDFITAYQTKKPIYVEDIVNLKSDDTLRGTEIFIRSQLTSTYREISTEARRQRINGKLKYVWEKDGRVLIRKQENSQIIQLQSMQQLMEIINNSQSSNEIENEMESN